MEHYDFLFPTHGENVWSNMNSYEEVLQTTKLNNTLSGMAIYIHDIFAPGSFKCLP